MPQRLPIVDSDDGTWGDILRQFLMKEHYNNDLDNPANGGHQMITVRAGTTAAGTAPIKLTSGSLMTTPEAGAIEFNTDTLYFTQTTSTTRKKVAIYDDASGATGDIYYRNSGGMFVRLGIGSTNNVLTVSGGVPSWQAPSVTSTFSDASFTIQDNIDATKQLRFEVSGIPTATTSTLTVPNASTTLVGTDISQTLTNKTLTSPVLGGTATGTYTLGGTPTLTNPRITSGGYIADNNGNEQITFTATASAINDIGITNAAAGGAPSIAARGGDTNVSLNLVSKGTGVVQVNGAQVATLSSAETLTNKTMSGSSNTFSNIPQSAVTNLTADLAGKAATSHTHTATNISDSTTVGRSVLTAVDAAAARTAIGAGTGTGDVTLAGAQTLTNKTISGASNTLTNIALSSLSTTGTASSSMYLRGDGAWSDLNTLSSSLRANRNLNGGGTITVDASGNVLWSARFLVIANGRGTNFATAGYFDITCPTSGTITGVGGSSNKTATASGIPLAAWEALYYILPVGSGSGSVAANFRVATYTADLNIPHDWVLICFRNGDNGVFYFNNGINLQVGQSLAAAVQSDANTANTLVRRNASGDFTAGIITASRFTSIVAVGTAPFTVTSTTAVTNLNADMLDGLHASSFATLTGTETLTNKTLTTPRFASGGYIADNNGNEQITFTTTASAINDIGITNAATGGSPSVAARGGDTNINLNLISKGTGVVQANGVQIATLTGAETLTNKTISGSSNTLTNIALSSLSTTGTASSTTYLRGDGQWTAIATGGDASTNTATSVDNEVALFSGTGGKTLKRATITGIAKLTAGVLSAATAGTDYVTPAGTETLSSKTLTSPVINGTVTGTATATAATANALVKWDANKNVFADNFIATYSTIATNATITTLTVASTQIQVLTGTSTHTVRLPTTSVLAGTQYRIINNSTGAVTVQSSAGNQITILAANTSGLFTALQAAPTANTHWDGQYWGSNIAAGKTLTISQSLTLAGTDGTVMTFPGASDTVATLTATQTLTGKSISGSSNTLTNIPQSAVTNLTADLAGKAATSHTHTASQISDSTATGQSLITAASAAAARTAIGTVIGTDVQAYNATLTSWAGKAVPTGVVVGTTDSQVLSGKTLTAPRIASAGFIADANGNEQIIFTTTASAVNEITITNAATAGKPTIAASGSDTNVTLNITSKGTGTVQANGVDIVGVSGTQTLTSKTISGSANTLTNIGLSSLSATGTPSSSTYLRGDNTWATIPTGGDASTNTATSVDNEVALFSGTGGKTLKRATITGIAKLTSGVLSAATAGTDYITPAGTETLSNKRVTTRINTVASSATPAINTDTTDQFTITALATNITSMSSGLSGTPVDGQKLIIRIKDNNVSRTIAWGASWRAVGLSLPITTTANKLLYIGAIYNGVDSMWEVVAVNQEL